ncbi:glycosyltransferase [Tepidiphilus sp. J10]|uniref:glycosyltransferase n=1 Tax=Tepidiphilus sp. J10 TaxID=2502185 RepID=UPI00115E677F|nr:glycosyltransferase [Tepidiphilus sp. J10]
MSDIKISIITATYNAAAHLPRLIESLLAQTDQDFEWVVADGGSADGTLDLLEQVKSKFKRLIVDSRPDFGIYDALNRAIKLAEGDYYVVLGADDFFFPNAVADYKKHCQTRRHDLVSAQINVNGKIIKHRRPRWLWLYGPPAVISGHAVGLAIRCSLHEKLGYYDRNYKIYGDGSFLLKCLYSGASVLNAEFVAGEFSTAGVSNAKHLASFVEQFVAQVSCGRSIVIQNVLMLLRILRWRRQIVCNLKK